MPNIDFPVFTLPAKFVDATQADNVLYSSFLHKSTVNRNEVIHKAGNRDAALPGMGALLAADIEANYKSLSYPTVLATAKSPAVTNGQLLFTAVTAGTASEDITVNAVTAHQAGVTVAVSAHAITISLSDTAANNTANAVTAAVNSATAAAALVTASLAPAPGKWHLQSPTTNDGTGLVSAFSAVTLTQANTLSEFGKTRMLHANISTERGN